MKYTLSLLMIIFAVACSQPVKVTSRPDPHTSTSGTLGSAKFNNQLPQETAVKPLPDSTFRRDSL